MGNSGVLPLVAFLPSLAVMFLHSEPWMALKRPLKHSPALQSTGYLIISSYQTPSFYGSDLMLTSYNPAYPSHESLSFD